MNSPKPASDLAAQLRRWRGVDGSTDDHGSRGQFSQALAAAHLGVPVGTYRNWEQGRSAPSAITVAGVLERMKSKPRP